MLGGMPSKMHKLNWNINTYGSLNLITVNPFNLFVFFPRICNLELLNSYGSNVWIKYNEYLETLKTRLEKVLNSLRHEIEDINLRRKNEQLSCGQVLRHLEAKWLDLVKKNRDLQIACLKLENEIELLTKQQEENTAKPP